jgi:hypothetical protein
VFVALHDRDREEGTVGTEKAEEPEMGSLLDSRERREESLVEPKEDYPIASQRSRRERIEGTQDLLRDGPGGGTG